MPYTLRWCVWVLAAVLATGMAQQSADAAPKGKKPGKQPPAQDSFTDLLQFMDTSRWTKADGWANGPPFDNAWSADNVAFADGDMRLRLNDTPMLGESYTSGEYRTSGFYGYGCYEVSMKPASKPGLVSSFFTYAGPWDDGGNGRRNEIDIEFPGTAGAVQFNYWTNDDNDSSANEILFPLTFDASADFHAYGFKWTSGGIAWYVDGNLVYEAFDTALNPTPKASESLQKIMMNLWAVDETAEGWAGTFEYPGSPLVATYEWVRFTSGEDCQVGLPPAPPEPEVSAQGMHVAEAALIVNSHSGRMVDDVRQTSAGIRARTPARPRFSDQPTADI